ncbi:MAG TPA: hypothetical protein VF323_14555 [Candidatus Limnocylindrales bacterium]
MNDLASFVTSLIVVLAGSVTVFTVQAGATDRVAAVRRGLPRAVMVATTCSGTGLATLGVLSGRWLDAVVGAASVGAGVALVMGFDASRRNALR